MWLSLASFVGTLGAYIAARAIAKKASHVLVNSFILGALLIIIGLYLTGIPYEQYRAGAQPIAFLLGPATVALAVPLFHNLPLLRRNLRPILIGGIAGALVGSVGVIVLAVMAGLSRLLLLALIPKSVTTPVSVAIVGLLGGDVTLAAALTTLTGFTGVLFAQPLLNWARVRSPLARGLALGVSIHGMGTGAAAQESHLGAAVAGIGMTVAAVATALVAPVIAHFLP